MEITHRLVAEFEKRAGAAHLEREGGLEETLSSLKNHRHMHNENDPLLNERITCKRSRGSFPANGGGRECDSDRKA